MRTAGTSVPNVDRLVEDLSATLPLYAEAAARHRPVHPTPAALGVLGARLISDDPEDVRAHRLRSQPWELKAIAAADLLRAMRGEVRLSYLLGAVACARRDLDGLFNPQGLWRWDAVLTWLVLHGIEEHRLWPFVSQDLVSQLLRPSLPAPGGRVSPLQSCVLQHDVRFRASCPQPGSAEFQKAFGIWMSEHGEPGHQLFWLRSRRHFAGQTSLLKGKTNGSPVPPTEVQWPSIARDDASPGTAGPHPRPETCRPAFRTLGEEFPCLVLDPLHASQADTSLWIGNVRLAQSRTGVEFLSRSVGLRFPTAWLPRSVVLLSLDIPEAARAGCWVRLLLDDEVIDLRDADAFDGRVAKILLPEKLPRQSPVFQFQFGCSVSRRESRGDASCYAKLTRFLIWQLVA